MTGFDEAFLVDTNILIYAHVSDGSPKHEVAEAFVLEASGLDTAHFSVQNIAEFLSVLTRKYKEYIHIGDVRERLELLESTFRVLYYDYSCVVRAFELFDSVGLHFWDGLLVATMLEHDIALIYTENVKDFGRIPEITAVNPFS